MIPQRDLRHNVADVLRRAEAGATFLITVRGRPVARLVPPGEPGYPRVDVDRATAERVLALTAEPDLLEEIRGPEPPIDFSRYE